MHCESSPLSLPSPSSLRRLQSVCVCARAHNEYVGNVGWTNRIENSKENKKKHIYIEWRELHARGIIVALCMLHKWDTETGETAYATEGVAWKWRKYVNLNAHDFCSVFFFLLPSCRCHCRWYQRINDSFCPLSSAPTFQSNRIDAVPSLSARLLYYYSPLSRHTCSPTAMRMEHETWGLEVSPNAINMIENGEAIAAKHLNLCISRKNTFAKQRTHATPSNVEISKGFAISRRNKTIEEGPLGETTGKSDTKKHFSIVTVWAGWTCRCSSELCVYCNLLFERNEE